MFVFWALDFSLQLTFSNKMMKAFTQNYFEKKNTIVSWYLRNSKSNVESSIV